MNLQSLKAQLSSSGWKNISPGEYKGIEFNLIGTRHFAFLPWHILVRSLPLLDIPTLAGWQKIFDDLNASSKKFPFGSCFLLVLIVEEISLDEIVAMSAAKFGLLRVKGGGGNIIIASTNSKQVYGTVPKFLPYDVRKFTSETIAVLKNILIAAEPARFARIIPADGAAGPEGRTVSESGRRKSLFISYSREDAREKDSFVTQLRVLESVGLILVWTDDSLAAGSAWESEIMQAISRANAAILLISAHSLTSQYILNTELPAILTRREKDGLVLFPIVVKPCAWKKLAWLTKMNVLPRNGRPVWEDTDRQADFAMALIVEEIATVLAHISNGT